MESSLRPIIVALRFTTILYGLVGIVGILVIVYVHPMNRDEAIVKMLITSFMIVMGFGMAVLSEIIIKCLHQKKRWAWIAAIVICSLYIPSLLLPLGALGLWGLLNAKSRSVFLGEE